MDVITLDFETYYGDDYTLSRMTTADYIRDPRFETIGVGITNPMGKRKWFEHADFRRVAAGIQWQHVAVLAHHAHFDGLILSHHYGVQPAMWFDTLSMANAIHGQTLPGKSLAKLAQHYGAGEKGDEVVKALGKHRHDFSAAEWQQYGQYCLNDCDLTYRIFQQMLVQSRLSQTELLLIDATVRLFTEPSLVLDEALMQDFLAYEIERKQDLLNRIEGDKSVLMSNEKFAGLLVEYGVVPGKKWSTRKIRGTDSTEAYETWAFAKTDAFMQGLAEHEDDDIRALAEARIGTKSTINETRTQRFLRLGAGGAAMPVYLRYAAAHTLRWGGADSMNWQNLQRVNKKKPWSGTIRKSIRAPAGHEIVVADSSQIEARTTAYLAGETWLIRAFAEGRDIYSEFASTAYGRVIDRKRNPGDELEGFVGKVCILGLGFGMGGPKLAMTFLAGAIGGPPVIFGRKEYEALGIDAQPFLNNPRKMAAVDDLVTRLPRDDLLIHCVVSDYLVGVYRKQNPAIAGRGGLWDRAKTILGQMNEGVECDAGFPIPLRVFRHGIQLEGFAAMRYPGLEFDGKDYTYLGGKSGKERVRIHGPAMTENIVQYVARCVVSEQMLEYRRVVPEARLALMTHDEVGSVVPVEHSLRALATLLQIMKTAPAWAPGLPLNAEGGRGTVYGDIK